MTLGVLGAIAWSCAAGLLARAVVPHSRPGVFIALAAGFAGWTAAFAADEFADIHALHPSRPESLLPATATAVLILLAVRRRADRRQRRTIFF